jgi:polar amino acid transport system substrate-binding protein
VLPKLIFVTDVLKAYYLTSLFMKSNFYLSLFFVASLVSQTIWAETKSIVIGLDEWPLFAGKFIKEAFAKSNYEVSFKFLSWARVEAEVKSGKLDAMGNLYQIDEIKKYADYSNPYYVSKIKFASNAHAKIKIKSVKDLEKYKIGYGAGYSFGEPFDSSKNLTKIEVPLTVNGLKMLSQNRLDLVIDSEEVLNHLLKTEKDINSSDIKVLDFTLNTNTISLGVLKTHPNKTALLKAFNEGLEKIKKENRYNSIIKNITGFSEHSLNLSSNF